MIRLASGLFCFAWSLCNQLANQAWLSDFVRLSLRHLDLLPGARQSCMYYVRTLDSLMFPTVQIESVARTAAAVATP